MDNLKSKEELEVFAERLRDRFGPIPPQVEELVQSFELRWLAQELGLEKIVLKSGKMIGYFVNNPQSSFYDSIIFTKILDYIQKNSSAAKLSEKNDRLRIIYSDIKSLEAGHSELENILIS